MNVYVVTNPSGIVLGVYTKRRRAQAAQLHAERTEGAGYQVYEFALNDTGEDNVESTDYWLVDANKTPDTSGD